MSKNTNILHPNTEIKVLKISEDDVNSKNKQFKAYTIGNFKIQDLMKYTNEQEFDKTTLSDRNNYVV